ncbi:unnamed protein product [Linum trigynum]|uniref:RING-type E3 ubiquitin transferase n=1 Tax=Linum trigynum TaxID=586398 RepID=A0AAV2DUW2_9ROSI
MSTPADDEEQEDQEHRREALTFWCAGCDVSIRLLITSSAGAVPSCPHCHRQPLHLMDDIIVDHANHASGSDDIDTANLFLVDSPSFRRFLVRHHCAFNACHSNCDVQYLELLDSMENSSISSPSSLANVMIPSVEIEPLSLEIDPVLECAVCKELFVAGEEVKQLPCSHFFHSHCIIPWLSLHKSSCPLCRFQLLPLHNFCDTIEEFT